MFVVVTLMPEARRRLGGTEASLSTFATPTIVHFCGALLISAIFTAPWNGLWLPTLLLLFVGIHNAWDSVTYITSGLAPDPPKDKPKN